MSYREKQSGKGTVDAAAKAWLTNVLIPAMVRQYLAALDQSENSGLGIFAEVVK